MSRVILYLGGARSGKSRLAQERFNRFESVVYIATAQALDSEMSQRIRLHQQSRSPQWVTIEEPLDLVGACRKAIEHKPKAILLDCLTLWLSNKLLQHEKEWNYAQEQLIL